MRSSDLWRLAFSGMWRQKTRTLLTLLGVALGACMLTFSLSIGEGVQNAVSAQFRKHDDLRRIHIYGGGGRLNPDETGIPAQAIEVKGHMSPERRARIRKMLVQQWHDFNTRRPPTPLDRSMMNRLTRDSACRQRTRRRLRKWAIQHQWKIARRGHADSARGPDHVGTATRLRLGSARG